MGNYKQLKDAIAAVIKTNGNQEITGAIMQNALLTIISTVGANATFEGIATPSMNPGTPDQNVFYIASENGTYSNFGGVTLTDEVAIFSNTNGSWVKSDTGIATSAKVSKLERKTTYISFAEDKYNIGNAILQLIFYSARKNITLQKSSSNELKFYEWNDDFSQNTKVYTFRKTTATSNVGDIYIWDNEDCYLMLDFSKVDKTFGNTALINNVVLGTAFLYERIAIDVKSSLDSIMPFIRQKNAYLYYITSANSSLIPSLKDGILTIPAQNVITEGHSFFSIPLTTITLSEAITNFNYGAILVDKKTRTVSVVSLADASKCMITEYVFFLGIVSKTTKYLVINSKYWKIDDVVYSSETSEKRLAKIESDILELENKDINPSEEDCKIIMGEHLYCIDGEPLPIYKSSLVVSNKVAKLCLIQKIQEWTRFSEFNFKFPKYNYFEDALYFDATDSPQTLSLAVVKGTEDVMYAVRGIQLHHVSKDIINGKSIKYLPYGASNTGFGFGRVAAEYLKLLGCTVQTIGVLKQGGNIGNNPLFPCYGEGRGGWGYMTYIGKKPYNQGSWITYPPVEQKAGTFTGTMNPFMKPATEDDKINHAEYCFPDYTHAGQDGAGEYKVWSLQEIRDKGLGEASYGQFYIYDFQWYLDNRPVEAPDVMTIQLGLNDSPAIEASQFALPWILGSITTAVPNCKIGICPSPAVQQTANGDNYVNNYSSYNNWLNTYLEELGNTNVTVLNLAVSMNRQFDFAFNTVSGEYISDDGNLTEKVNVTGNNAYGGILHSDNNGFMEIGKCIGAFIANNLVE